MSISNIDATAERIRHQVVTSMKSIRNRLSMIKMLGIYHDSPLDIEHQAKVDALENEIERLTDNALMAMDQAVANYHIQKSKRITKQGETNGEFHRP